MMEDSAESSFLKQLLDFLRYFIYNKQHMDTLKQLKKENKRWVVAVSGGADSMSLLDMCREHGIFVVVAHVNYKHRDSADRDMFGVRSYCEKYNIPFACHIVKAYPKVCNFQAYARDLRYAFFKETLRTYECDGVLVAHQLDDHLETYLLQKKRGAHIRYAGIQASVMLYGMHIERPLLNYTKQELETYCKDHHVTYYDDESNFTDDYARNQIRHRIIDTMSVADKHEMVKQIASFNERENNRYQEVQTLTAQFEKLMTTAFLETLVEGTCLAVLRCFFEHHSIYSVSEPQLRKIRSMLLEGTGNNQIRVKNYVLCCEYGMISLRHQTADTYHYQLDKIQVMKTPYFYTSITGDTISGVTLSPSDFPITIRNAHRGDKIALRFGTKRLSRWFIDRKIPASQRSIWPIVENKYGKIIFVVGIGCDIEHFSNNPNLFVLK